MLTLLSIVPVLVAGQVLMIYFTERTELQEVGRNQASSEVELPAKRGEILDQAERRLVVNTARYDLALDPTVQGFHNAQNTFFERLSKLTGQSVGVLRQKVSQRKSPKYVLLVRGLNEVQKEQVDAWDVPGVILEDVKFARRYNYGMTAAHLLGHVDTDGTGKAGLELQYNAALHGVAGKRAVQRDRRGIIRSVVDGAVIEPKHGETVVLTIDLIRQTILEEELAKGVAASKSNWGTAVAVDPKTGAILAMANVPTYNPNRPGAYPTETRRNHAITDMMEPGSTFKLVGSIAALEEEVIAMDDSLETGNGYAVFARRPMRDTHANGTIPFAEVIAKSSNIGMAQVAERLEPGDLYRTARNLGFGQFTWIDFPGEVSGLLKRTSQWSGTTLTRMSIGYEVAVTPLQMVMAYAALANGGVLRQPYLVAERRDLTGHTIWRAEDDPVRRDSVRRVFKNDIAETLLPAFELVVNEGTAKQAQVEGLRIAGKTGTARKASGGSYGAGHRATFVGFFPADDPQVAMIVVMDAPKTSIYGGGVAAPVFQRVARRWIATFPQMAARIAPPDALPSLEEQMVPDVMQQPATLASHHIQQAGFRVNAAKTALGRVSAQNPEPGTLAKPGTRINLTVAEVDSSESMPDLTGLSAREAMFWLQERGVTARLEGNGTVVSQSPKKGARLPVEAVLRCR